MQPSDGEYFGNLALKGFQHITAPETFHWMPLAPAWYLLGGIVLLWLGWKVYLSAKKYSNNAYRREALYQLQELNKKKAAGELSKKEYLRCLRQLIKATALRVYPRNDIAALSGKPWQDFLNSKTDGDYFSHRMHELMDASLYQQLYDPEENMLDEFSSSAAQWIKYHRVKMIQEQASD